MSDFPSPAHLLPHDPPMVLIDEVIGWSHGTITCRTRVRSELPFVESGRAPALLTLELMAQAAGCANGLLDLERGRRVKLGFLLGTRELVLETDWLEVGDECVIEAKHVFGGDRIGTFDCVTRRNGAVVARAVLNVLAGEIEEVMSI